MRHLASSLVVSLVAMTVAHAAPATVKLRATPRKVRTFYEAGDARIPISIRNQLAEPARIARRGRARWTLETDALIRDSVSHVRYSFNDGLPVGGLRAIAITTDGAVWAGGAEGWFGM